MVQVHLDAAGSPVEATYAQHRVGETCSWPLVETTADGRPVVYVARGSHASYFESGDKPSSEDAPAGDMVNGDAPPVTPALTQLKSPTPAWLAWPGRWGGSRAGLIPGEADSPDGPSFKGQQWLDPMSWGARQRGCWERTTHTRASVKRGSEPATPTIKATARGNATRISYSFSRWPADEAQRPTSIHVAIHSSTRGSPPLVYRHRVTDREGVVRQPLGLGSGPYTVSVVAYSRSGHSARVLVPLADR